MGDSISVHYGPFVKERLEGRFDVQRMGEVLEALTNLDIPRGANIGDSDNALKIIRALCESNSMQGEILLLNCGLHDVKRSPGSEVRQVPIERYRENLREIARLMASQKTRLVWVRTTPADENVHNKIQKGFHRFSADVIAYNAAADEVMNAANVPMIDLHKFTLDLGLGPAVFSDHVHYPEATREKQAAFIAGFIEKWWR